MVFGAFVSALSAQTALPSIDDEITRLRKELEASGLAEWAWADLERCFFGPGVAVNVPVTGTVDVE